MAHPDPKTEQLARITAVALAEQIDQIVGRASEIIEIILAWLKTDPKIPSWARPPKELRSQTAKLLASMLAEELHRKGVDQRLVNPHEVQMSKPLVHALAGIVASVIFRLHDYDADLHPWSVEQHHGSMEEIRSVQEEFAHKVHLPSGRTVLLSEIDRVAKEIPLPPLGTPNNLEVAMMGLARFSAFIEAENPDDVFDMLREHIVNLRHRTDKAQFSALLMLLGFGLRWRQSAFARLEVGHRLAAALMFTDVDETVQAPWLAWSLILPDGLFGDVEIRRVWCVWDRPAVLLMKIGDYNGTIGIPFFDGCEDNLILDGGGGCHAGHPSATEEEFKAMSDEYAEKFRRCLPLLRNLIRGTCLALSDPKEWRKGNWQGKPSGSSERGSKHKELPLGERYVLGQPVQIDLREEVLEHIRTGRVGGGSPTKLFLVRGHHRRQAHGPGRLERKTIWIEPFWKGPEDARVLLRPYQT